MFVNRHSELQALERRYQGGRAEFLVVYGRRRVGKTMLLKHFARPHDHVYFLADLRPEADQIRHFAERLAEKVDDPLLRAGTFSSWDPLFETVARVATRQRLILVVDEFPYLRQLNPAMASVLQRTWDERWRETGLCLVLCGSQISVMENEVLGHTSPLYGRRTGQLLVEPFAFRDVTALLPHRNVQDQIATYAIAGGIPAYVEPLSHKKDLWDLVADVILSKDGFLYNEVRFALAQEMREPRSYFAILAAIAQGRHKLNEIVQGTGLPREVVTRYLEILRDLRVVRRDVPVTESQPLKSRRGLYRIDDNFFRFWFRFVYPNTDDLEQEEPQMVLRERIQPHFSDYVSAAFEDVCRQAVHRFSRDGSLPFRCQRVGAWWDSRAQIDVVGLGERDGDVLVGECKWSTRPVGTNILEELKRKTAALLQGSEFRTVCQAIFSRAGFTRALEAKARAEGVLLYTPEALR